MASKTKRTVPTKKRDYSQFPQIGIYDMPDFENVSDDDSGNENDLEYELEALLSGKEQPKKPRVKKKVTQPLDIEKLAADCLKDSDDEDGDDSNLSTDEDIINELKELTSQNDSEEPVKHMQDEATNHFANSHVLDVLEDRLILYTKALETVQLQKDTSKIRRFKRAIETLNNQVKLAKNGATISEEDIPPPVSLKNISTSKANIEQKEEPYQKENIPQKSSVKSDVEELNSIKINDLISRRNDYKQAALVAKKTGDKEKAFSYLKSFKVCTTAIEAYNKGNAIDLENLPPALDMTVILEPCVPVSKPKLDTIETESDMQFDFEKAVEAATKDADASTIFMAPSQASTVLEALEQRLQKYSETKKLAESENNSSKIRRLDRIIKQYQVALKDHKNGKPVAFEDLPVPPGFPPIPLNDPKQGVLLPSENVSTNTSNENSKSQSSFQKEVEKKQVEKKPISSGSAKQKFKRTTTISEKNLEYLLERQHLFRQAAIEAKKDGNIGQAKEYLRNAKGFDAMIEASKCGLPIDTSSIPTPPQLETDFVIVQVSDCKIAENTTREELLQSLESDLCRQIEVCSTNKEHFLHIGDVASAAKFEKLSLETVKDLAVIRHLHISGAEIPKFHYETRVFSIVKSNLNLNDNDIEVIVERGINLPGKANELDSYVKIEFPHPSDSFQTGKSSTVHDTLDPVYKSIHKFSFDRKSRSTARLFKRQSIKFEVFSKGGFFRNDNLIGSVAVKLNPLESKCSIHDSYDLMIGRKSVGGKLEVEIRIRQPTLVKEVVEVQEKWLVIGT